MSGTCRKACPKCCYETLAEILNKMAFPGLGLCRGSRVLSPWLISWLMLDAAPPHRWVTVSLGIIPVPVPASPSGTAAMACAGRGCPERDGQAQLGAGQGQQPCQGLSRTHHGFGVSLSDTNSRTTLMFVASLLLKAGSHLNQQHIVAKTPFCRNPLKKSCGFPPWQVAVVL